MTQTAVSNHEGSGEFFSDNDLANLEVGGTIFGKKTFILVSYLDKIML